MRSCELCGHEEADAYLRRLGNGKDPETGEQRFALKCRRCQQRGRKRELWDALTEAELAVVREPDSAEAITRLRAARVDYEVACRGTAAGATLKLSDDP